MDKNTENTQNTKNTQNTENTVNFKRLLKDVKQIMKNPLTDNNIHYAHSETDMFKGYALLIGPPETPYEDGFYFFEFNFTSEYPFVPPVVTYHTNDGITRFNPNLYRRGKVCLSILNTWRGEQWSSCQNISTILLTLITIFNNNPLLNEPGYSNKSLWCVPYKNSIEFMNYKTAIINMINKKLLQPQFLIFYPIILNHFNNNKGKILERIKKQIDTEKDNKIVSLDVYHGMKTKISYTSLKNRLELLIKELN